MRSRDSQLRPDLWQGNFELCEITLQRGDPDTQRHPVCVGHIFAPGKLAQRDDLDIRARAYGERDAAIHRQHQVGRPQCLGIQKPRDMAGRRQSNLVERQVDRLVGRLSGVPQHPRRRNRGRRSQLAAQKRGKQRGSPGVRAAGNQQMRPSLEHLVPFECVCAAAPVAPLRKAIGCSGIMT